MSQYKKKGKGKIVAKLNLLEHPLKNGFRRALVKGDGNRLLFVYYVTPDSKYLKDVSTVCDWIENEKQGDVFTRRNFNFVARKYTSHENEVIIDYGSLPNEMKEDFIQKKRSIAPTIVMVENDDSLSNKVEIKQEVVSKIPNEAKEDFIEKKRSIAPTITVYENDDSLSNKVEKKIDSFSEFQNDIIKNDVRKLESDDESMTLSVESTDKSNNKATIISKPQHSYEYPLADVSMNCLIEIGSHCHIDRLKEFMNSDVDPTVYQLMKSYCGNQCFYDCEGHPRVAFECDICLILWHTDCIGYRWITIATTSLIVCDNCYLLQSNLNVDITNIFCDVENLLHSEFEISNTTTPMYIPIKVESIFRLCKLNWIVQSLKSSSSSDFKLIKKETRNKEAKKDSNKNVTGNYRFFIKTFVTLDSILPELNGDSIILKFTEKDVDRMASIFADRTCEMQLAENCYKIYTDSITVKNEELIVPIEGKLKKVGIASFHTFEYGQDNDPTYAKKYEDLKSSMTNNCTKITNQNLLLISDSQHQIVSHLYKKPLGKRYATNPMTRLCGPLSKKSSLINSNTLTMKSVSSQNTLTMTSVSSQNLPKNAIPITMNQIQNISNIIKIRKRKQDFSKYKLNYMVGNKATVQYHNLDTLPFSILEHIMTSKNLSTQDKLNCRVANRVLKCVIDGGRVWNKVVINTGLITGLQTMFEFFSKQNVKKITFIIDFQESFGIEFFTSFIGRLKMFPECFDLEKISVKLIGYNTMTTKFRLSIQDILNCIKTLKYLSISSDQPAVIMVGKQVYLTSDSLEKLKLKNIDNISATLNTTAQQTPKLRHVQCGDFSRISYLDPLPLSHITSLILDFSDTVHLMDINSFSLLTNLDRLVIARPQVSDTLGQFCVNILKNRSLNLFYLDTVVETKAQVKLCKVLGGCFPINIRRVYWRIFINSFISLSELDLKKRISDFLPVNVILSTVDL